MKETSEKTSNRNQGGRSDCLRPKNTQNPERRNIPVALFTHQFTFDEVRSPTHTSVDDLQPKTRAEKKRRSVTGVQHVK
jgi:hypothetical protein